ncbi:MAG TPA: glycosyltransferase family 2 protein [Gaiellaceae bacterium]|nr:glycosyltransferase family 2 protein [Gaiellaceae bacterium]
MSGAATEEPAVAEAPRGIAPKGLRRVAIVPAHNEEGNVGRVVREIRDVDPELEVVVVDDGSLDRTAAEAAEAGATVVRLPFNLGIGGAVQTGFRYAFEHGYELAVRLDGDAQHDPAQLARLVAPVLAGDADIAVGSRFLAPSGYRPPFARRIGIAVFAKVVSLLVRNRVTDTTSGFQALNRRAIALFAADYPHDYPEVEATLMVFKHTLTLTEVPVTMRERGGGSSSITALRSVYYAVKVLLAVFVGALRRNVTPLQER